ncbi:carbohydrate ABC transporter permease [Schaalia suimastitidis]|uniref:carbohydrate ABC transporter permease n=1 Tax=Schaalia suimastitidis TaxID=121163 RepID=UPI0004791D64|nr:sugar ABC transporter permease [Schaalia suimastitidis]
MHDAITGWMFLLPFVIGFVIVFIVPIIASIYASFFQQVASGGGLYGSGELTNQFVGLDNFINVATSSAFWMGIGRVIAYTIVQVPFMILSALALALVLDSFLIRRVTLFRLGYFLPFAIPGIVSAMIWLYIYTPEISPIVRALNAIGVPVDFFHENIVLFSMSNMTTWTYTGYNMLIFLAALQAIPTELYDAARIDGATGFQVVTKVKIPMVRGAVLLTVLLSIVGTIQIFSEPTVMATVNPWMRLDYTPMQMAYNTMFGNISPGGDGPAAAVSIMMAIVAGSLAVIYAWVERKISQ